MGDHLGAGGATSFVFEHGEVFGWRMTIQGSQVRILDSVLPHEVTHTIFATHFRQPLPRWADEGACTTVEHTSEKAKQQTMLVDFLRNRRGIAFGQMFTMKDYPQDVMPLYSQGYSVARYLIAQGGKRKFLDFLSDGLRDENWTRATKKFYGIANLSALQNDWLAWVRKGSPSLATTPDTPGLVAVKASPSDRVQNRSADAPRPSDTAGVYEMAAVNPGVLNRGKAATDKWHVPQSGESASRASATVDAPPGDRSSQDVAAASPNAQHQVTRPQGIERPRQVILEWSRNVQAPDDTSASVAPSGYPAASAN
jgi:hypothetical protein